MSVVTASVKAREDGLGDGGGLRSSPNKERTVPASQEQAGMESGGGCTMRVVVALAHLRALEGLARTSS